MNQKTKDEAREKIIEALKFHWYRNNYQDVWSAMADGVFVSGETDEVCDECEGTGQGKYLVAPLSGGKTTRTLCTKCDKGTIKHKWHIEIVEG